MSKILQENIRNVYMVRLGLVLFMVFNDISVISWRSVSLVE